MRIMRHREKYKKLPIIIFFDLQKAYDKVNRKILMDKIPMKHNERFKNLISLIFNNQRLYVFNDETNEIEYLMSPKDGLPQGNKMACFLFNLYINEILDWIEKYEDVQALAFADDICVLMKNRNLKKIKLFVKNFIERLEILNMNLSENKCVIWPKNKTTIKLAGILNSDKEYFIVEDEVKYLGYNLSKRKIVNPLKMENRKKSKYLLKNFDGNYDTKYISFKSLVESKTTYHWLLMLLNHSSRSEKMIEKLEKEWNVLIKRHFKIPQSMPNWIVRKILFLENFKDIIGRSARKILEQINYTESKGKSVEEDKMIKEYISGMFKVLENERFKEEKIKRMNKLKYYEREIEEIVKLFVWKKNKNIYLSMNAEEKNTLKTLIEGFK